MEETSARNAKATLLEILNDDLEKLAITYLLLKRFNESSDVTNPALVREVIKTTAGVINIVGGDFCEVNKLLVGLFTAMEKKS